MFPGLKMSNLGAWGLLGLGVQEGKYLIKVVFLSTAGSSLSH